MAVSLFYVWKVTFRLQQLSDYNTIADISKAPAHRVTSYFLSEIFY